MKHLVWFILCVAWPVLAQTATTNHFDTLKNSSWFAISGGFANTTTAEANAVAAISRQTNAVAEFKRLLDEPGPAQNLYGLLGLHVLSAPEFKPALQSLLNSKTNVRVLGGCIVGEREVAEVARQIQNNQWNLPGQTVRGGKYGPNAD